MKWLRSVVRSRLGEDHSVEDVLNDVVADALAIEDPLKRIKNPAPWLYRLAIRKVLLFRRKSGRRRKAYRLHSETNNTSIDQACVTPLDYVLLAEKQTVVRKALTELAGQDAEILTLKYVHDWSYSQISENLGIDYWKVVHRLRQARRRLRQLLETAIHETELK